MKLVKSAALALALLFAAGATASAQVTPANVAEQARLDAAKQPKYAFSDLRGVGVGLVIMGAAIGIGWLTRSAVESMSRQPEVAGNIQTAMIIGLALIESLAIYVLVVAMILLFVQPIR